jgi:F420-non-reducing hydrogenase large subunit
MKQKITIDPITRLEGHGKIEIFLNDEGNVENTYFQVPELRGFEQFCIGRQAEEMPIITNRICGVCPEAHHIASTKALDGVFGVEPTSAAKKIRELFYSAFFVTDHTTHFYALGGPDFIVGPDAPAAERNILGVIAKVGIDIGKQVIECRKRNHHVLQLLAGRSIHPVAGVPGGWSKKVSPEERDEIIAISKQNIEFGLFTLQAFKDIVLGNPAYLDLILSDTYLHKTYYMGLVDQNNRVNFYDGAVRVVDPEGHEFVKYNADHYLDHIAEIVFPWTYLKYPYLKNVGWKGFVDGKDSGVYTASPLSRLNVSDSMATPKAQEHFEMMYETFGGKKVNGRYEPIHHRLATHWARVIELLYSAERMLELASDPEIISDNIRNIPKDIKGEGVGCCEAPRGTLTHHYKTDDRGVLTHVNLIVGTTNNYAPMSMSIKKAAEKLIQKGNVSQGLLNKVEMAFRLYDPCLSCATHSLPGEMPLIVSIKDHKGAEVKRLIQN